MEIEIKFGGKSKNYLYHPTKDTNFFLFFIYMKIDFF